MGQSAGGSAVDYYSYTYVDDPIVAGLISHSGTALSFAPNTPDFSQTSFLTAATSLGCTGSDVVSCMRSQDFHSVLNASAKVKPLPSDALAQPVFHPTIDNKTVFSLADYRAKGAAGDYAKLPYLAGNNNKEDGFYHIPAAGQNVTLTPDQWLTFDLEGFTCATGVEAASRAAHGVPMWRYRYFGDWPNLRLYPGSGAYHGSDLHMIFGGTLDVTGIPDNIFEYWTTEYMMWAWATFVKNPTSGLSTELFWPLYDPSGNTLVRLGYNLNPGPSFVSPGIFDNACPTNGSVAEAQGAF